MLTYRNINYEQDLEQIIPLIQKNLDPAYTLNFFRWKHQENPFGKSYGLLALDGEKIVGLRMFMFWKFQTPQGKVKAIRPVDTVTDKDYRGKGIFKKLTLDGLQNISGEYELIFNTPNTNSLPGYLKMGWSEIENLDCFKAGFINPFLKSSGFSPISIDEIKVKEEDSISNGRTLLSNEYLQWRYKDPVYQVAHFSSEGSYVIYKKSKINRFPSIIIYELIGCSKEESVILNSLAKWNNTPFVYYFGGDIKNGQFLKSFKRNTPVVVIKDDKHNVGDHLILSLGDLEGKL